VHHDHRGGVALGDGKLVEAEAQPVEKFAVGVEVDQAPLFEREVVVVEAVDGIFDLAGGRGGQEAQPAGVDAQDGRFAGPT
jgi:hypothetical protein